MSVAREVPTAGTGGMAVESMVVIGSVFLIVVVLS